ncbi:hypothetical protein GJW-30_1_02684 [Variibacter gotjawalensis]|uniref:DUF488 domain-containing protein n=1 Tax=Variibacter gotjawalensis TaxID=1333996 RepID=A0A0S3PWA8_9BRAD|nr:DUF488 family protein [Variibacter gotjawalensis]NIK45974.1 uncharacterized protein YeaO (DUF488 family) [Variibacter gotjawalensis]RZS47892.1 uncharacterized protein DUF488 [Variibacter gotjawalensis]BAT60148.1 hypothetical protein GJW-30_1_02684 [Variibacter gotjawalensis]
MARGKLLAKRAYDPPHKDDGLRILVDRLWPRGISKDAMKLAVWAKEIAPSNELRKWYHRDLEQFPEFRNRYRAQLALQGEKLGELRMLINGKRRHC